MQELLYQLLPFVISVAAFAFGVARLFKKKKPLYFQILVCSAGCFAIRQLFNLVYYFCGSFEYKFNIGMLGIFGCVFFLLSANYGQLDRIVDDGSKVNGKAKAIALFGPVIIAALIAVSFFAWKDKELVSAVLWVIMLAPAMPASYFNLKHLIMPVDDFGFLKATKLCNIIAFMFYIVTSAYVVCLAFNMQVLAFITSMAMSVLTLGLVISADKGAKQWET